MRYTRDTDIFLIRQNIALELGTVGSPQHGAFLVRESRAESARLELLGVSRTCLDSSKPTKKSLNAS
jgi:hypothetical protein